MKIKITTEIKDVINSLGNKTARTNGLKIYAALYQRNYRQNLHGYFDCPSTYLRSINARYSRIIKRFIEAGILTYHKKRKPDPNDIFNTIETKSYSPQYGYCMKYKFLVDLTKGEKIDVPLNEAKKQRWYEITANTLVTLGYEPAIIRDSFGRRVHYPLIKNYKTELKGKGLCVIDAVASQPRLLYLLMKKRDIVDPQYNFIFENDLKFYETLVLKLKLKDRNAAKDLFMFWVNSSGYVPDFKIHILFPVASAFIKGVKSRYYKDSSAYLQREEAKIWIDDLLQNLPVEFALPVHDSLIVRREDAMKVLDYCKESYPDLRFDYKEL